MELCGFLAPDGKFTECDSWEHTTTAKEIVQKTYNSDIKSGLDAEKFLFEKGYVSFNARSANHKWISDTGNIILLTEQQRDFIINNLENANNQDQERDIKELMEWDDAYREDHILHHYENNLNNQ